MRCVSFFMAFKKGQNIRTTKATISVKVSTNTMVCRVCTDLRGTAHRGQELHQRQALQATTHGWDSLPSILVLRAIHVGILHAVRLWVRAIGLGVLACLTCSRARTEASLPGTGTP